MHHDLSRVCRSRRWASRRPGTRNGRLRGGLDFEIVLQMGFSVTRLQRRSLTAIRSPLTVPLREGLVVRAPTGHMITVPACGHLTHHSHTRTANKGAVPIQSRNRDHSLKVDFGKLSRRPWQPHNHGCDSGVRRCHPLISEKPRSTRRTNRRLAACGEIAPYMP